MPSSSDGGPSPSRGSSPSSPSNPSRRSPPPQSEPDASPAATHQPPAAEGTRSGGRLAGSCSWGKILEKRAKRALILSGPRHGVKSDRLLGRKLPENVQSDARAMHEQVIGHNPAAFKL